MLRGEDVDHLGLGEAPTFVHCGLEFEMIGVSVCELAEHNYCFRGSSLAETLNSFSAPAMHVVLCGHASKSWAVLLSFGWAGSDEPFDEVPEGGLVEIRGDDVAVFLAGGNNCESVRE